MQKNIDHENNEVSISTFISASPEKVYQAWTKPEVFGQWMGPGPVVCKKVDFNLEINGEFRIEMQSPEKEHVAYGKYLGIEPNKKLHMTWQWEEGVYRNSELLIELNPQDDGTQLSLKHTLLPDNESREHHSQGWEGSLEKLVRLLTK